MQQLADELVELVTGPQTPVAPKAAAQVQEQLAAKLQRKRRALERDANLAEFRTLAAGTEPDAFFALLTDGAPAEVVAMLTAHPGLVGWLDRLRGTDRPPVFVSGHFDDVVEVSSGYGKGRSKPEDYLDAFRDYLETHRNALPALMAVMQRPRELTRTRAARAAPDARRSGVHGGVAAQRVPRHDEPGGRRRHRRVHPPGGAGRSTRTV